MKPKELIKEALTEWLRRLERTGKDRCRESTKSLTAQALRLSQASALERLHTGSAEAGFMTL